MAVHIHAESHLDHGISKAQMNWVLEQFKDRDSFFAETVTLPEELGTVPCSLHGPDVGEQAVPESKVHYAHRGQRPQLSRMTNWAPCQVRQVSVIAGAHDGRPCVLFTAFGGPIAPFEVGDPNCKDEEQSRVFWSQHALSV